MGTVTVTNTGAVDVFQLENGAFPTSLIITAGATATRAVDLASITGIDTAPWFNAAEGTFVAQASFPVFSPAAPTVIRALFEFNDNTNNNRAALQQTSSNQGTRALVRSGNVSVVDINDGVAWTTNTVRRGGFAYKVNDFAISVGGAAPTVDTAGAVPVSPTTLYIGSADASGNSPINGHLERLTYWSRRLPNAQLQAITL